MWFKWRRAPGFIRAPFSPSGLNVLLAVACLMLLQYRADLRLYPVWRGWADQDHYLSAARAWAALNFDPAQHNYPPGYPLLGALFVHLTPAQPFLIPNLICSAAALVLFTRIARRLRPDWVHAEAIAALCFIACTAIGKTSIDLWVVPWTTTAAAPLLFACILMALRYQDRTRLSDLAWLGLAAALCVMVRPSDGALIFLVCAGFCAAHLIASRAAPRILATHGLGLAACFGAGLLLAVAAHVLVHGWSLGRYVGGSAATGFEWRLIPLRWVTLFVSPRPLFPQGAGMASVFFWLPPGIAGMFFAVCARPARVAAANALVAIAVGTSWLLYLSYRDLEPYGLWRFNNAHYFKWTLPFLGLWAIGFLAAWVRRAAWRPAALSLALAAALFCWRPEFVPSAHGTQPFDGARLIVPGGLRPMDRVVILPVRGVWRDLYYNETKLQTNNGIFSNTRDFKLFPIQAGAMLMPLRPLPAGDAALILGEGLSLPARVDWQTGSARLVFGIPCLVTPRSQACKTREDRMHPPEHAPAAPMQLGKR